MDNIGSLEFLDHVPVDPKKVLHMPVKVFTKKKNEAIKIPKLNIDVIFHNTANTKY